VVVWLLDLQLPIQSVPITTDVVGFDSRIGRGVQHYVITFVVTSMRRLFFEMYKIGCYCTRSVAQ
jgi:hypothetical protein